MPTPASVSDRLRSKKQFHASWAADMDKRLDAIDEIEAKALPVIEGEMQERERSVQSLENDALAMQTMAEEIAGKNDTTSSQSLQGSGAAGNGSAGEPKIVVQEQAHGIQNA